MKIGRLEKKFVSSKRHAQRNIELIERLFEHIDLKNLSNVLEIGCGVGIIATTIFFIVFGTYLKISTSKYYWLLWLLVFQQ